MSLTERDLAGITAATVVADLREITREQWLDLFDALDLIKNGAMELHQRATGVWEIKAPPATRRTITRKAN